MNVVKPLGASLVTLGAVACLALGVAAAPTSRMSPRPAASASPQSSDLHVLAGAVQVRRPSRAWTFDLDKTDMGALTLSDKAAGIQVVLRWADNRSRLSSLRVAAVLESRLMGADNSSGRKFSMPRRCRLAGEDASRFAVEMLVADRFLHRTEYVVVSHGAHTLVVAVSGGDEIFDKRRKEIDAILDSVMFMTSSKPAAGPPAAPSGVK